MSTAPDNWISFSYEMLLAPSTQLPDPFTFVDGGNYQLVSQHQELKLEDFLGGQILSSQESSSSLGASDAFWALALPGTASNVSDSASATGEVVSGPMHVSSAAPAGAVVRRATHAAVAGSCQRTSIYRGVTRHRWTGRYEAHLWDNTCVREGQKRKGRQVYLGGYDDEGKAARAYDLAALKYWGLSASTNFPTNTYCKELEEMKHMAKQEFIASLRRKSSGFSRGASMYRGVTRHHQHGRWQARIGRVAGNKDIYLGTFSTEEEAAEAYDVAAIKFRGVNAVTNFELSRYNVEAIASTDLPIGASAKRIKQSLQTTNISPITQVKPVAQLQGNAPAAIQNLLQLYPVAGPSSSPPCLRLCDNDAGYDSQRLYWPTTSNQYDTQIQGKQLAFGGDPLEHIHLWPCP